MSIATVDHRPPTPPFTSPELDCGLHHFVEHEQRDDSLKNFNNRTHGQAARQIPSFGLPETAMQDPRVAAHYPPRYYAYGQYPDLHDPSSGLGIEFVSSSTCW